MFRIKFKSFNWKYILGEILLIFIGINLAIWFNNWNTSRKLAENKAIAIAKIEEEINNNLNELVRAREANALIPGAIQSLRQLRSDKYEGTVATFSEMISYQKEFPGFYTVVDSIILEPGLYRYEGDTYLNLELASLTEIAWETSKDLQIANEFGFDCLYELENMYNVQRLVQKEINKSAEALQSVEIERLERILEFIRQLDSQLERDYNRMLENIENCY